MTNINNATTPTLIQHGEFDARVPTPNAYELYQGLQDVGAGLLAEPVAGVVGLPAGHQTQRPVEGHVALGQDDRPVADPDELVDVVYVEVFECAVDTVREFFLGEEVPVVEPPADDVAGEVVETAARRGNGELGQFLSNGQPPASSRWRKQSVVWSLTMPIDCISA